jgi:hypothetical protein
MSEYWMSAGDEGMGMRVNEYRFKDKGFVFLALNPGWVDTDLAGEGTGSYVSIVELMVVRRSLLINDEWVGAAESRRFN